MPRCDSGFGKSILVEISEGKRPVRNQVKNESSLVFRLEVRKVRYTLKTNQNVLTDKMCQGSLWALGPSKDTADVVN